MPGDRLPMHRVTPARGLPQQGRPRDRSAVGRVEVACRVMPMAQAIAAHVRLASAIEGLPYVG
jgi:hypothetical protein